MKLQKFNRKTTNATLIGRTTVRVAATGTFAFSKKASLMLNLKPGSLINLHQDQERPSDWYIEVTKESEGLACRTYKNSLVTSCVPVAKALLQSLPGYAGEKSVGFKIAETPEDSRYYAIITSAYSNPVNKL